MVGASAWILRSHLRRTALSWVIAIAIVGVGAFPLARQLLDGRVGARFAQASLLNDVDLQKLATKRIERDVQLGIPWILDHPYALAARRAVDAYAGHFNPTYLFTRGDDQPRHHGTDTGQLYLWDAPLILAGLVILARRRTHPAYQFTGLWLLIGPVPASLATEAPHAVRSIVMLPAWYLAGGIGAVAMGIHIFIDGLALAIAFTVNDALGFAVFAALLVHAFSDGLNLVAFLIKNGKWNKKATLQLLNYGAGSSLFNALNYAATKVDVSVLPLFSKGTTLFPNTVSLNQAGMYERGAYVASLPITIMAKLSDSVLFSGMSKLQEETERLKRVVLAATNALSILIFPVACFVFVFSEDILRIYLGNAYTGAAHLLQWLFVAVIFRTLTRPIDSLLRAKGAVYRGSWIKGI
ncbi:MAG: hypothetical protein EBZ89_10630, partial [Chloroflexi bacterium]|nr:hypothetical protein [Chloroflexota bacterium]